MCLALSARSKMMSVRNENRRIIDSLELVSQQRADALAEYETNVLIYELSNEPVSDSLLLEIFKLMDIKFPEIVLAQAKLETGNYTSPVFKNRHNLFGLYSTANKQYYRFNNWLESVYFYRDNIQSRYSEGDYYHFLELIGYAEDPDYVYKLKRIVER